MVHATPAANTRLGFTLASHSIALFAAGCVGGLSGVIPRVHRTPRSLAQVNHPTLLAYDADHWWSMRVHLTLLFSSALPSTSAALSCPILVQPLRASSFPSLVTRPSSHCALAVLLCLSEPMPVADAQQQGWDAGGGEDTRSPSTHLPKYDSHTASRYGGAILYMLATR